MKLKFIILAFCTLLLTQPARATPEDAISLHDQVIGFSETQVFILRETSDNLGRHIYGMHDVYLVAKSIETGADEEIWPVYRVYSASEATPPTVSFPLDGAVNPFKIMAERAAQYSNYAFSDLASSSAPAGGYGGINGLWVEDAQMEDTAVMAQIAHSIAFTSGAIQPYPSEGFTSMSFHTPQELLAEMKFTAEECSIYSVRTLYRYPLKKARLVRIGCEDDDGQSVSLVVVIPQ